MWGSLSETQEHPHIRGEDLNQVIQDCIKFVEAFFIGFEAERITFIFNAFVIIDALAFFNFTIDALVEFADDIFDCVITVNVSVESTEMIFR